MPRKERRTENGEDVYLLPAFDEYLVGYKDRSAMLSDKNTQKMLKSGKIFFSHSNGIFLPTVIIDGQVMGTWKRALEKGKSTVRLKPFARFTAEQIRGIKDAVGKYSTFLGTDLELRA